MNGIGNDTGMNNKNDFYIKFIYVVRKLGIKMNFSFCNDEIVSIGKEDLYRFIEEIFKYSIIQYKYNLLNVYL